MEDQTSTSMEDRKQRKMRNLFQWVGIPLMFGFVGFFFVGPSIGGPESEEPIKTPPVQDARPVLAVKAEEPEEWTPPSPPQGSPIVDDPENEEEVTTDEDDLTEVDRPIPPPIQFDGDDGDEAGLGGMMRPPVKDDTDDDNGDDDKDDDDGDDG